MSRGETSVHDHIAVTAAITDVLHRDVWDLYRRQLEWNLAGAGLLRATKPEKLNRQIARKEPSLRPGR
jgi:hypothetical protein